MTMGRRPGRPGSISSSAVGLHGSVARPPLRLSFRRLGAVIAPLAAVEGLVYVLVLHDSVVWWLSFTVYLALGVVLPGTLVAQSFVHWRTDWLTWIGLGWALGHVLEVVSIQLAKTVGVPRLFLLWIPIAYLFVWRRRTWQGDITPLTHPRRIALLLAILMAFATTTFVVLNLVELSPQPTYQSDVWFHITEAAEFRDHLNTGDPRIAGQPYAYHTLEYGPAVGATLAVQVPLANLITRYSGLSMVWLLILLLFNSARTIRGPTAGFLAAALIVAPLDVFSLISSKLSFGSAILYSGLDLSTSTLVGYWALAALFLPLRWSLAGGRLRDLWVVALLAYVAAGSKSVPGLLLLVGIGAVIVSRLPRRRRLGVRPLILLGIFTVVFCATTLPVILRPSEADSATIVFAAAARLSPYADQLLRIPDWLRLAFSPIGLSFALWVGLGVGAWKLARAGEADIGWFLDSVLVFAAYVADSTSIPGDSELFFLYMAMVLAAPVAGVGLFDLGQMLWRRRATTTPVVILILLVGAVGVNLKVGGTPSLPFDDGSAYASKFFVHVAEGVDAYRDPGPPSPPKLDWYSGGNVLRVTPEILQGLTWLRSVAVTSTVIATNVPGSALYAGLCECQEYYQTEEYASAFIAAKLAGTKTKAFDDRARLLTAWFDGTPGSVDALRKVGITYLVVDKVNGLVVHLQGMPKPAFMNRDIAMYRI